MGITTFFSVSSPAVRATAGAPLFAKKLGKALAFLALVAGASACSVGTGTNLPSIGGGNGSGNSDGSGTFLGDWTGNYSPKVANATTPVTYTPVTATFTGTDDTHGSFAINLTQVQSAYTKGTYSIVNLPSDQCLLLQIAQSTVSTIGMSGSTKLNYELVGTSLGLSNDRIDITLTRPNQDGTNPPGGGSPGTPGAPSDALVGTWNCTDPSGSNWRVDIKSNATFAVEVFAQGGNRSALWMAGGYKITRATGSPDAVMTVNDSDVDKYDGMVLDVYQSGGTQINLQRMSSAQSNASVVETIPCNRS